MGLLQDFRVKDGDFSWAQGPSMHIQDSASKEEAVPEPEVRRARVTHRPCELEIVCVSLPQLV